MAPTKSRTCLTLLSFDQNLLRCLIKILHHKTNPISCIREGEKCIQKAPEHTVSSVISILVVKWVDVQYHWMLILSILMAFAGEKVCRFVELIVGGCA